MNGIKKIETDLTNAKAHRNVSSWGKFEARENRRFGHDLCDRAPKTKTEAGDHLGFDDKEGRRVVSISQRANFDCVMGTD